MRSNWLGVDCAVEWDADEPCWACVEPGVVNTPKPDEKYQLACWQHSRARDRRTGVLSL